ncbi:MAG TPA: hypothetical protein VHE30_26345 [Polyangiaceae bacterium]|nr:hypothetical protein [Polyangiaceae bacterium]
MRQSNARALAVALVSLAVELPGSAAGGTPGGAGTRAVAATSAVSAQSPWRSCLVGFSPGRDARVDALRLSVACGPVTGLDRHAHATGIVDEAGPPVRLPFTAVRGDCFRVFAVADAPVDDLEAEVVGPKGVSVTLANQGRRWVVLGEEGPFCPAEPGDYEVRLSTHAGRGNVAAYLRRGARMRVKGSPYAARGSAGSGPSGGGDPY